MFSRNRLAASLLVIVCAGLAAFPGAPTGVMSLFAQPRPVATPSGTDATNVARRASPAESPSELPAESPSELPSESPSEFSFEAPSVSSPASPLTLAPLADTTFWRMVTELSEPDGWFRSENFVSNEMAWQYVIAPVRAVVPSGRAYLGVGPEQNFTYLATLEPSIAFIVDIRRQNLALHLWYKALFELAETRAEFLSLLFARPRPSDLDTTSSAAELLDAFERRIADSTLFRETWRRVERQLTVTHGFALSASDRALMQRVDTAFAMAGPAIHYSFEPGMGGLPSRARSMPTFSALMRQDDGAGTNRSFLGSEGAYRAVRDMQRRNHVVPVTGDFAGAHALPAVGAWLRAHGQRVGTFYLSNVEQYLFQDNTVWPRFYANVGQLPIDSTSTFIRSVTNRWTRGDTPGPLMSQLIASMPATLAAFRNGRVQWYGDVIAIGRPD
jgi:hypothetical protein